MAGRAGRLIERRSAFWDASALVPLCVRQSSSPQLAALYNTYGMTVWWATPIEMAGAFARLARMKLLAASDRAKAVVVAAALADAWMVIRPLDNVRANAMELVARYDLRAGDAFQLAAALEWCQGVPAGRIFLTADRKLREAAQLNGFDAPPIN